MAEALRLQSNQVSRVDVRLEVGDASTRVLVDAAPPVINLEEAKVAATVNNKTYENSPMGARNRWNPNMMLATMPQVQPSNSVNNFTISGITGNQIEEGMDGFPTQNTVNQIHNIEDVEEVLIVTNNNSAQYPRAGYFNWVQRFPRRARVLFPKQRVKRARVFRRSKSIGDLHAASAGGRILLDKTFFYAAYDGQRDFSRNQIVTTT